MNQSTFNQARHQCVHASRRRSALVTASLLTLLLGACATPVHLSQPVSEAAVAQADQEIRGTPPPHERRLNDRAAEAKVRAIFNRLEPGARDLCYQMGEDNCQWDLRYSNDPALNAFAAGADTIVIQKGVLSYADSEEEIAMVIAHEMAHHAANHISETKMNAMSGALVGGLLMGALGAAATSGGGYDSGQRSARITDSALLGAGVGAVIGQLRYSKDQENEADYLAAYILERGGYDPRKARTMWAKLARAGRTEHGERHSFDTHPDPAERLARWDETVREMQAYGGRFR
ncbi:M48 family metallopeptidase [Thiorhodovibrio frisius]|uniref:Peptidase family M48 n=1 Tax=Thiorhodovibrio frisius TaxID=631362 RepID=H8YZB7_9GAMM|nr:M48 family metallopeptidase [Thiorhodovibrio frisius]EIC22044.1 Peptidase family M48 [Thiorhodovibrio frisius]WPL24335.1 TPR repeat-containing protein YfgC precursor [Thiorhodovibrio frisius]